MVTSRATHALVRDVPDSFDRAIRPDKSSAPIDVSLAQGQHRHYCSVLEELRLDLIRVPSDRAYPDCCFVEDTAVVVGDKAVIATMGAATRRGESAAVEEALRQYKSLHRLPDPATLDGGDVLLIGDRIFVGLSSRTSAHAVEALRTVLSPDGYLVFPVAVRQALHLKSVCTYLGDEVIVCLPGEFDEAPFARYRRIRVPAEEGHAANCLSVNDLVLMPAGAPKTRALVEKAGFATAEIEISELRKAGAGLTCSSIIL
ncbi:MAG: dimethylargininase [Gemmatimonadota bacterium]|nr:MAG: dimethylargininase [Gemmatimonadota bacterium]